MMKKMSRSCALLSVCVIAGGGVPALASGPAAAQVARGDSPWRVHAADGARFIERPGEMEFSGSMIARPWPVEHWTAQGLEAADAQSNYDRAVQVLRERFGPPRRVPQTDQYIFEIPEGASENEVADDLLALGLYKFVEPNWTVYPTGCPDDPLFGQQWHHDAAHFDSCDGWDKHTGEPDVAVGVCDTGVRYTHEDLQLHRLEGYNAVDRQWESDGGDIDDIYGHGTEATGTAAANGDNGIGVSGMGWNLSHRMLRVTNSKGGGSTLEILNHAAVTAVENGDKVASISYHGVDNQSVLDTATYIKSIGGLMIWAAGNQGRYININHRDDDDVIAVGAVNRFEVRESWSNHGPFVDFVAYGSEVRTVSSSGDHSYRDFGGTSAACPQTSGLAALLWSMNPNLTPDQVEQILKETCLDLGAKGQDDFYGYGRIHLSQALEHPLAQPEGVTAFEVVTGTLLDGEVSDLITSDDSYVHIRSGFGVAVADLHKMEMIVNAVTAVDSPVTLDLSAEARVDEPSGVARLFLRNWNTNEFDQVAQYAIGMNDQVFTIEDIDAADYVNQAGEIDVMVKHNVVRPFLAFTFESFVDQVVMQVN